MAVTAAYDMDVWHDSTLAWKLQVPVSGRTAQSTCTYFEYVKQSEIPGCDDLT